MIRKKLHALVYILQIFYLPCYGDPWDQYLYLNKTSSEGAGHHIDDSENVLYGDDILTKMNSTEENEFFTEEEMFQSFNDIDETGYENNIDIYDNLLLNYTDPNVTNTIIEELNLMEVSADSLTISWSIKGENVSSYKIEWFTKNMFVGNVSGAFSNFVYTIKDLLSCTKYNIRVSPEGASENKSKDVNVTTSKTQPGAPLILTANPDKFLGILFLNISWQKPSVGGSCIKHYSVSVDSEIHGNKHFITANTTSTYSVMRYLHACTSYLVTVKAIDLDDRDGLKSTYQSQPTLSKVAIPPKLINSMNVPPFTSTNTTITLNWNVQDKMSNCSVVSIVTVCRYSYTKGYGFEVKYSGIAEYNATRKTPNIVRLEVSDLSPSTKYICRGWVTNIAGHSPPSIPIPVFTKEDAPSAPQKFHLLNNLEFTFGWEAPEIMPGQLQKYKITIAWEPMYPVPDLCAVSRKKVIDDINASLANYTWHSGEGYSKYTAYIEAQTGGGWSPTSLPIMFSSRSRGVPDEVTNLKYETKPQKNDSNALETILSWNLPCSLKGQLQYFEISVLGRKNNFENHSIESVVYAGSNFKKNDVFSINLGELKPQYLYIFEIAAFIYEANERGAVAQYSTEYPAGIPPQPAADYLNSITLNSNKIQRTSTSFEILLPLFPDTNGEIQYYAIIVSRLGARYDQAHTRFSMKTGEWPNISSWKESMEQDFMLPYQASKPRWTPYPNHILDYGSIKAAKVVIGDDITCKDVSLSTKSRLYCNGPLKADTWYEIRMRAFTNGGYSDSSPITVKTEAELSVFLIVGLVLGILLLGILAALLLAGKSHFKQKEKNAMAEEDSDQERGKNRRLTVNARTQIQETPAARTRRRFEQNHE